MDKKSLRQLAREIGVSASYLSQVKNGIRPVSERVLSILMVGSVGIEPTTNRL
jgi:transcriptional regulator with XRE-family HTH domain